MDYEAYLRTEAFEFLRHRHIDTRNRLLRLLHELGLGAFVIVHLDLRVACPASPLAEGRGLR
jgi:hypothetical protein